MHAEMRNLLLVILIHGQDEMTPPHATKPSLPPVKIG